MSSQNSIQGQPQQRRADFQQLGQSLNAGSLAGAQQAFSALMSLMQGQSGNSSGNSSPFASGNSSPLSGDLAAIGQALQGGNLSAAQQGFTNLMQQVQSMSRSHHHHHGGANALALPSNGNSNSDGDGDGSGSINVMA